MSASRDDAKRILNAFQRDGRAMLEQLLPALRQRGRYPDASVDGWGDARGGRSTASTVILTSPRSLGPRDGTKELARLRLELGDAEWTAIVSVVARPDDRYAWPPSQEAEWWAEQGARVRAGVIGYQRAK